MVPSMAHWIGLKNREVQCTPLLDFRDALQRAKILRKYKEALLPTRRALAAFEAGAVKELVLESLIPAPGGFEHVASVLLLTHVATATPGAAVSAGDVARALTELGWHVGHGPVPTASLVDLPAWQLLINVGEVGEGQEGMAARGILLRGHAPGREALWPLRGALDDRGALRDGGRVPVTRRRAREDGCMTPRDDLPHAPTPSLHDEHQQLRAFLHDQDPRWLANGCSPPPPGTPAAAGPAPKRLASRSNSTPTSRGSASSCAR